MSASQLLLCLIVCSLILAPTGKSLGQEQQSVRRAPLPRRPLPRDAASIRSNNIVEDDELPSITYGSSRSSSTWVETDGVRVAVDDGIEYNDCKYYISLTFDLIAVDSENKSLWSRNIGAFWNHLAIEEITLKQGEENTERFVVAIRNKRNSEMESFVEYFELESGEPIEVEGQNRKPTGEKLTVKTWSGRDYGSDEAKFMVFDSEEAWADFRLEHLGESENIPPADAFDSQSHILVFIAHEKNLQLSRCFGFQRV